MASQPVIDEMQAPYRPLLRAQPQRPERSTLSLLAELEGWAWLSVEPATVVNVEERPVIAEFSANYRQWLDDTLFASLPAQMTSHESFQSIVGLGERAVPLIAAELRKKPSFLFLALEDITGADPVEEEDRGDLTATVAAWLSWLRK